MIVLAELLAKSLAKYQEDAPWEDLSEDRRARHRRLGGLLALDLSKLSALAPPASPLPSTPTPATAPVALALSIDQAVEVSVAVPLMVGAQTVHLSPKIVQLIFATCLAQIPETETPNVHG